MDVTMRLTFREPGMFSGSKATKHEVAQRTNRRPSSLKGVAVYEISRK